MKGMVSGQWNKVFFGLLGSSLHGILPFSLASLIESCSLCYCLKDLFTHPCTNTLTKLFLTIKTDDIRSSRSNLDCTGGYWRFRGE